MSEQPKNVHVKMTQKVVDDTLPSPAGEYFIRDTKTQGLALRVHKSGRKVWIVQRKYGGRSHKVQIGQADSMKLEEARSAVSGVLTQILQGVDPNLERRKQKRMNELERDKENLTVKRVWTEFVDAKKTSAKPPAASTLKGWKIAEKKLEAGKLWTKPILDVSGLDLQQEFNRLAKNADSKKASNGGLTQAGQTLRTLRSAFNYATTIREMAVVSPFLKFNQLNPGWYRTKARTRTIVKGEGDLKRWWDAVESLRSHEGSNRRAAPEIADFLVLTLLWGGRQGEVLSLRWENVDFERGIVCFPDTKNDEVHEFPLAPYARAILERRKAEHAETKPDSPWVFPSPRKSKRRANGTKLTSGKIEYDWHLTQPRKTIAAVAKASGCNFSSHDLRRTFGTLLSDLNENEYTVKRALNHKQNDTAGKHYVHTRWKKLREAYENLENAILIEVGVKQAKPEQGEITLSLNRYQELLALEAAQKAWEAKEAAAAET